MLQKWSPYWDGYYLYYPSRRQSSPAFVALLEVLRRRGSGRQRRREARGHVAGTLAIDKLAEQITGDPQFFSLSLAFCRRPVAYGREGANARHEPRVALEGVAAQIFSVARFS